MFNMNYLEPYYDTFNIYNLITKIDQGYRLFFNKKKKRFQIINTAKNNQICLNFDNFSLNILKVLQETRIENSKIIFENIDKFNNDLEEKYNKNLKNQLNDKFENLINYSKRTNHILKKDIQKILEGNND